MDHSLPFMSRKVVRFAEYDQVRVQEEGEIEGSKITSCLSEDSGLDEKTGLLEMGRRVAVSGSHAESDLEAGGDVSVENAIMDKLFQACDPGGKGRVRVSDLVEYLTTILDMQLHRSSAVSSLISVMDPNHINSEIDAETFHRSFHKWIEQMKSGSLMDMSLQSLGEESLAFDNSHSTENIEYTESWGEESCLEDRLSISQLSSSLTDLQHINRKLSEEIKESRTIIDVKEEELSKLSKDLQMTQSQVKRLQELADLRHEAEIENEELREDVATLSKQLETEKLKKHQTEQEKELLKAQLQRYKAQVSKLTAELDVSQQGQEDLKAQLAKNKEKISQLKVAVSGLDSQLAEKDEHIEELQRCVREVTKVSEDLKKQHREIQQQLNEAQQNLHSFKSVVTNTSTHAHFSTLREMASEIEDDMEQLKTMNASVYSSSIHNELQFLLNDSPNLPWPLSEKELKESVVATPDLVSQVGNAMMMSRQNTTEEGKRCEGSDCESHESEKLRDSLPGTCQCSCDYHYDVSHEKLRKFVSLMKYFRDENKKLRRIVTKCCLTRRIVTELDGNGIKETPDVRAEQPNKPVDIESIYQTESGDSVIKLQTCSNEKLLLEIAGLRRSHLKLAEDLHNSEIHICELDEELHNTQVTLNIEKQRCAELEESLYSSTLARQLDLKDIWRLVQKDVETECEEFQDDSINTNATDKLKEKITREIGSLRNNCEKKESFLGSLKNNNLDLHFTRNNDFYRTSCWNYGRKLSPSSPLVDALTIDAFNGNFPMHHINYPYQSAFVSCEDVDCYECRAARLFLQSRFAASCPSMVSSAVTQGFELNSNVTRHPIEVQEASSEVCHSSAEVATDVNIQVTNTPKRKRSLYGSYRRQDFIKSSGRCAANRASEACFSGPQLGFGACVHTDTCSTSYSNNKTSYPSLTCDNFLPSNCNLNDARDEPCQGIRRPSFTLAVECNHLLSLDDSQPQSKENNCSFTEELRRPSFKAAIERGKDNYSAPNSTTKRKFVQIASPEITESRKITALCSPQSLHKDEGNLSSLELPKSVKFYLDETDKDHSVQAGSMKLSSSSQQNNFDGFSLITPSSSLSSSQSSALMSASWFSSMSSSSGFDDLGHSFTLGARYSQEKEDISGCAFTEQEHGHHLTDVSDVPTADGSQHSRHMAEVTRGPYSRNVAPYASPQSHHIKVRACKPAVSARPSNSLQYIAHNAAATSTAALLHSYPLSSSSVPASLASSRIPMKSPTESHGIHETPRDARHVGVNINIRTADISPDFSGCDLQKPGRRVAVVDSPSETRCFLSAENTKLTAVPSTTVSEIRQKFWIDLFNETQNWGDFILYEQDWLDVETDNNAILTSDLTAGQRWLQQMGNGASKFGPIYIQYCMSYGRHILQALEIPAVTQARVSGDYHPGNHQWNIGITSILVDALNIAPFKDTFYTTERQAGDPYNATEPNTRLQALISTLSTGPVGPGDGIGYINKTLLMRCCDSNGLILKPAKPATAIDDEIKRAAFKSPYPGPDGNVYTTHTSISSFFFGIVLGTNLLNNYSLTPASAWPTVKFPASLAFSASHPHTLLNFSSSHPIGLGRQCTTRSFCLYYTSPILQLDDGEQFIILGELDKWVPMSHQRFNSIQVTGDDFLVQLMVQAKETVTFSYHSLSKGQPRSVVCDNSKGTTPALSTLISLAKGTCTVS